MSETFDLRDLGDRRVLEVDGREHVTHYSARVVRMLIERKGARRAPPYFHYKRTRGDHFLGPLFTWLRAGRHEGLRVLEIGCSFGHITEWLAEQPEVTEIRSGLKEGETIVTEIIQPEEATAPPQQPSSPFNPLQNRFGGRGGGGGRSGGGTGGGGGRGR